MIVYPNSKINIGLTITSKRSDGFHNIESIFYPIPWCDILEINISDTFEFTTSGLKIEGNHKNNLVLKAYQLIKTKYQISNCKIHLHKQIPMGAGLGGGSADAAFTLSLLNEIFGLSIPKNELELMADKLGSDCSFFIDDKPKLVKGKGEIITSTKLNLNGLYIKLINPNIHISTTQAFSGIKISHSVLDYQKLTLKNLIQQSQIPINDFEHTIFPIHPTLSDIKKQLKTEGAIYTSMTGTGSTIYGLFTKKPSLTFDIFNEKIFLL